MGSFGRMMKLMVVGLLILGLSYVQTETKLSDESSDEKKAKVFSLFTVVNFPNDECTAKSDTTMKGTCYTSSECGAKSGTNDGNCAAGFGVCCTFTVSTCGSSVTKNGTYIENARSTSTTTLAFTIATGGTWKIRVAQIECHNLARAYPDCDQYLTGVSGIVKSYNWPNTQLRNTDWTFCIRREVGYCGIQYTQALPYTSPDSFALDDIVTGAHNLQAFATSTQGVIVIPDANFISTFSGTILAEQAQGSPTTTVLQTSPSAVTIEGHLFQIDHVAINAADGATGTLENGFKLDFVQLPCSGATSAVTV